MKSINQYTTFKKGAKRDVIAEVHSYYSGERSPAIITIDSKGDVLRQNPMFTELFEAEGRPVTNIYLEKKLRPFANKVNACFKQRQNANGTFTLNGKRGDLLHIRYNLFPIFNRRQNVENILATFETIGSLNPPFHLSGIGYWEFNEDAGVLEFSEEAISQLGLTSAQIEHEKFSRLMRFVHKKDRDVVIRNLRRPATDVKFDFRILCPEPRWLRAEIKCREDNVWGGLISNIDEWKKKEEECLRLQNELESFMYKSAHNLKGPAGSIHALTKIAINEVRDDAALRYLKLIDKSSERLEAIINDLLNLNKIKQSRLEIDEINLEEIISSARENLKFINGVDRIQFHINLEHTKKLRSDARYVYSIFQNLIENAIKYRGVRDPFVKINSEDATDGILFAFEDNGIGIPESAREKIFDMFYRAADSQYGSGLGLYIVKNAVSKLGGTINLQSKVGGGTTFILFLPQL